MSLDISAGQRRYSAIRIVEPFDTSRQALDNHIGRIGDRVRTLIRPYPGGFGHQSGLIPVLETDPDRLGGCEHQMT